MSDAGTDGEHRHHSRKLRILKSDRERGFKRCRKCRSINPLNAETCHKCGTEFYHAPLPESDSAPEVAPDSDPGDDVPDEAGDDVTAS